MSNKQLFAKSLIAGDWLENSKIRVHFVPNITSTWRPKGKIITTSISCTGSDSVLSTKKKIIASFIEKRNQIKRYFCHSYSSIIFDDPRINSEEMCMFLYDVDSLDSTARRSFRLLNQENSILAENFMTASGEIYVLIMFGVVDKIRNSVREGISVEVIYFDFCY